VASSTSSAIAFSVAASRSTHHPMVHSPFSPRLRSLTHQYHSVVPRALVRERTGEQL